MVDFTLGEKKTGKIRCNSCHSEILEYYHDEYKGYRGQGLICKIDFPLD